jgi:hypothetical protein
MNNNIIKRDEKGRFPKGTSGNPSGLTKDGKPAVQPAPIADFRDILALARTNDDLEQLIAPILGNQLTLLQPIVLQLAAKQLKKDSRILAIMLQWTLNRLEKMEAKQQNKPAKNLNQLEIEFERHKTKPEVQALFNALGVPLDQLNLLELQEHLDILQNPLSLVSEPALDDANSRENQDETDDSENSDSKSEV